VCCQYITCPVKERNQNSAAMGGGVFTPNWGAEGKGLILNIKKTGERGKKKRWRSPLGEFCSICILWLWKKGKKHTFTTDRWLGRKDFPAQEETMVCQFPAGGPENL